MKILASLLLLLLSFSLWSQTQVTTQVRDLDVGRGIHEPILVFLSSGQVAKIWVGEQELLRRLRDIRNRSGWVRLSLDVQRHIRSLEEVSSPIPSGEKWTPQNLVGDYTPSIISSPERARELFFEARRNHKESQCYNRAHVWAYEWRARNDVFSTKAWLFFTRKYIRKFDFEWWFHVAPVFHILDGGLVWERVMDVKYARGPLKLKQWTDIFLRNDASCPVVERYSDWADYPESGWCYVMKSSMYYYQPLDLELYEKDGTERTVWNPSEIVHAYKEAFDLDL